MPGAPSPARSMSCIGCRAGVGEHGGLPSLRRQRQHETIGIDRLRQDVTDAVVAEVPQKRRSLDSCDQFGLFSEARSRRCVRRRIERALIRVEFGNKLDYFGPVRPVAAASLHLGAYFRRLCSRMDKPKTVTVVAHKLARLVYTMLTKGEGSIPIKEGPLRGTSSRARVACTISARRKARNENGRNRTARPKTTSQINHLFLMRRRSHRRPPARRRRRARPDDLNDCPLRSAPSATAAECQSA